MVDIRKITKYGLEWYQVVIQSSKGTSIHEFPSINGARNFVNQLYKKEVPVQSVN